MRKCESLVLLVASASFLTLASTAHAAVNASDSFSYANGSLTGNSGGTGFSTAWGDANSNIASASSTLVASGQVTCSNGDAIYRGLTTSFGSSGTLWMGVDLQVKTPGTFGGLLLYNGTSEKFLVGGNNNLQIWTMGANAAAAAGSAISDDSTTTLKRGVVQFNLDPGSAGSASLWVSQGGATVDVTRTPDATITGLTLTGVNTLRIGSNTSLVLDNVTLGTTFADVGAVPEPGSMGLLGLGASGLLWRRRRRV
jgi:hypothetical protein